MKRIAMKRIAIFSTVLAFFALIAWVGGYNFDTRGFWVAYGLGTALWIAIIAVMLSEM